MMVVSESMMVVSGSMMLPVSQAPSICTGGASSSHHKKFENSFSTEEEDLVSAMEDEVDGEKKKSHLFVACWTAARTDPTRRDPLEDEPAAVWDETGRINLFDIPTSDSEYESKLN
ncbi:hypothetical protein F2Q70_00000887 [Brassica cretica]|uniref:Uncharacterized protein n=1 Tax=Brassica cretica TaxID=69181 RepID=A0A8S9ILR3_BRACR|nr:hypothetical protein F2Q70_00000887 [Brassica cretica]